MDSPISHSLSSCCRLLWYFRFSSATIHFQPSPTGSTQKLPKSQFYNFSPRFTNTMRNTAPTTTDRLDFQNFPRWESSFIRTDRKPAGSHHRTGWLVSIPSALCTMIIVSGFNPMEFLLFSSNVFSRIFPNVFLVWFSFTSKRKENPEMDGKSRVTAFPKPTTAAASMICSYCELNACGSVASSSRDVMSLLFCWLICLFPWFSPTMPTSASKLDVNVPFIE